jgi:hypothetical protein
VLVLSPTEQQRDYYSILGINADASEDEIRRAYRAKARQLHPDLGGSPDEMKLINEAYDLLTDPDARKAHDRELVARYTGRISWQPQPVEIDSASASARVAPYEVKWLISRAIISFLLGLASLAESGVEWLIQFPFYTWLIRGLALLLLLLGAAMLYTAHRLNQVRPEAVLPEASHIRAYRLTFAISIFLLVILLTALSFLQP